MNMIEPTNLIDEETYIIYWKWLALKMVENRKQNA